MIQSIPAFQITHGPTQLLGRPDSLGSEVAMMSDSMGFMAYLLQSAGPISVDLGTKIATAAVAPNDGPAAEGLGPKLADSADLEGRTEHSDLDVSLPDDTTKEGEELPTLETNSAESLWISSLPFSDALKVPSPTHPLPETGGTAVSIAVNQLSTTHIFGSEPALSDHSVAPTETDHSVAKKPSAGADEGAQSARLTTNPANENTIVKAANMAQASSAPSLPMPHADNSDADPGQPVHLTSLEANIVALSSAIVTTPSSSALTDPHAAHPIAEVATQSLFSAPGHRAAPPEEGLMRSLWPQDTALPAEIADANAPVPRDATPFLPPVATAVISQGQGALDMKNAVDPAKTAEQPDPLVTVQKTKNPDVQVPTATPQYPLPNELILARSMLEQGASEANQIATLSPHLASTPAQRAVEAVGSSPSPPAAHLQIAQTIGSTVDGVTELRLSPDELGQVRIDLRTDGDRLVVSITAERPETLDLLRRHADQLAAELRTTGQNQLDLSFGQWAGQDASPKPPIAKGNVPEKDIAPLPPPANRENTQYAATGLYLRI